MKNILLTMNHPTIIQKQKDDNLLFTGLNDNFYHFHVFNNIDDLQRLNNYFYKGSQSTTPPIKSTSYNININPLNLCDSISTDLLLKKNETEEQIARYIIRSPSFQESNQNVKVNNISNHDVPYQNQNQNQNQKHQCFTPEQKNTLFWCIYIKIYGLEEYNDIKRNGQFLQRFVDKHSVLSKVNGTYANIEYAERIKIIKSFQENTEKRKESNIKLTKVLMSELLSGILADIETSISSLYLFSIHYNQNIYLVNNENRTYIKFGTKLLEETEDNKYKEKIVVYYQSNNKKQKYYIDISSGSQLPNPEKENFEETYFELESIFKPFKGLSNYTVGNLHEIANKIGLVMEKMPKKQELYDEIVKHITWNF